jgi:hypothetical protein
MIFKGHYSNSLCVCDQKKDLKQRKKAKPIFTKNYIFANSINFFFMEMLIQQKKGVDKRNGWTGSRHHSSTM